MEQTPASSFASKNKDTENFSKSRFSTNLNEVQKDILRRVDFEKLTGIVDCHCMLAGLFVMFSQDALQALRRSRAGDPSWLRRMCRQLLNGDRNKFAGTAAGCQVFSRPR